jgi:hypothetical protein
LLASHRALSILFIKILLERLYFLLVRLNDR